MSQQNSLLSVEYTSRLKLLPIKETPAYRVAANADDCNLGELLAVMIGGSDQIEVSERVMAKFGSLRRLAQAHPDELTNIQGVGKQSALRLKAAISLGRKLLQPEEERVAIHSPSDAADILSPILAHREQEFLVVLVVDTRNRVIDWVEVYHGSLNSSMVRVAELFKPAIQRNAAAIIMSHNHPSGDPTPSPEDINLTRAVVQAGKLMDIDVLDHLVIGSGGRFVSLKERGLGFS
jgi:DNA repair protein RadC